MISPDTHKQYLNYSPVEFAKLIEFLDSLESLSKTHGALYGAAVFLKHLEANKAAVRLSARKVPASVLFWLYRVCAYMRHSCPVFLPHIVKSIIEGKEMFFVVTRTEWAEHKNNVRKVKPPSLVYVPHAIIQYLTRVKGIDFNELMKDAPTLELLNKGTRTPTGRTAVEHGNHVYILDGDVCITVLEQGMEIS